MTSIQSSMGGASHEVLALAAAFQEKGAVGYTALDLGCGEGRNTIPLAAVGVAVTSIDSNESHIETLRKLATQYALPVNSVVADVESFPDGTSFDVVLGHGILHFLETNSIRCLVERAKKQTKPGGYHVFTTAPFESRDHVIPELVKQGHKNTVGSKELLELYRDWELLSFEGYTKKDYHPGEGYHIHPIEKYIFLRPGAAPLLSIERKKLISTRRSENVLVWLDDNDAIGSSFTEVFENLGQPDFHFTYRSSVPQFSFIEFSKTGYGITLYFFGNIMVYVSNGVISGYSIFDTEFSFIRPFKEGVDENHIRN